MKGKWIHSLHLVNELFFRKWQVNVRYVFKTSPEVYFESKRSSILKIVLWYSEVGTVRNE